MPADGGSAVLDVTRARQGEVEPAPRLGIWLTSKPRTASLGIAGAVLALLAGVLGVTNLKMGVAVVAGVGLVLAVLLRPFFGALVLAGLVPIVSGFTPGLPIPYLRLSEALIGAVGLTLLVSTRREDAVPWGVLDWLLLGYGLAWAFFGTFDALRLHEHMALSDWGTVLGQLQFFLVYRGVRLGLRNEAERRIALRVVLAASVPVAVLAILQQVHAPGITSMLNKLTGTTATATSTVSLLRAGSVFVNWASLAGYLFPLLLVMGALWLGGVTTGRRWWTLVVVALAAIGLALTAELSAISCLIVCTLVLGGLYGQGRRILRIVGIGLLVGAVLVGPFLATRLNNELSRSAGSSRSAGVPQTLQYRMNVWTGQYFPAIGAAPLTGYGVILPSSISWPYPESQYVACLIDGGVPLLLAFGALMWGMVDQTRRWSRSHDPFDAALGKALFLTVAALIAMDLIWPYLTNAGLPQVLWALFAIAAPRRRVGDLADLGVAPGPLRVGRQRTVLR
ncbi:MAG: O-antigen ligase family protein [Acidimicrobiales bacterium]